MWKRGETRGGPIWTGPGISKGDERVKSRETRGGPIWTGPGISRLLMSKLKVDWAKEKLRTQGQAKENWRPQGHPTPLFPSASRVLTTFVVFHYRALEPKSSLSQRLEPKATDTAQPPHHSFLRATCWVHNSHGETAPSKRHLLCCSIECDQLRGTADQHCLMGDLWNPSDKTLLPLQQRRWQAC